MVYWKALFHKTLQKPSHDTGKNPLHLALFPADDALGSGKENHKILIANVLKRKGCNLECRLNAH